MSQRPPLHKNPWLWGFLIGIVLVTLTRPLLRRIPEPPPVLGRLPEFELVDAGGEGLGPVDLEGRVWILAFFSTSDDSACGGLIESMTELGRRFDEAGVAEVRLLGIGSDPGAAAPEGLHEFDETQDLAPPRWFLAAGDSGETSRLAGALLEATGESPEPGGFQGGVPRPCRLFLVDGSGGIRGAYRDDTMGLDEVFHRAQHVARAMGL